MSVRLGLLAASRIADRAVVAPARDVDGVRLMAVAARDRARAEAAAEKWRLDRAFGSYEQLIESPDVDAVYIGTPASFHRPWAIAAIEAGKHVLCEKPFAANADDARLIADAARSSDVVVMEAFHWRYHPYAGQIRSVLDSGALGRIDRIEAVFDIPDGWIPRDDIRWDLSIGGGATMDLGCYPIQWVRFAASEDPSDMPDVVSAEAVCPVEGVDGSLRAELRWPSGVTGSIHSSMIADGDDVAAWLRVTGERGTMLATNPLAPQQGNATLTVETESGSTSEEIERSATYFHQLIAFRDAIVDGAPFPTTADDGVRNMEIIDACYRAAGLEPRPAV
ncbi:MAG: Gfo/Idh/MocA family oxidoreductase [Ilumatobacter sp.]|uniref:Gfo/Idh/MocA family protein n=1 Tax=Ilumatobacter sp. TaxID=1967498 RepID=UPI002601D91A|nr:Gfo/Idh/MocA family oxidoreductase [Ilumatobacter sp.]MDJ0768943.1 Gfo/Idh/MocA family oxidoreductase [Ilumatobacter sp.]